MDLFPRHFAVVGLIALAVGQTAQARPKVGVTAGLEFPHILTGQVDLNYNPRWTIGFNLGGFAYTVQASSGAIPLSMAAGNVHARWAPFHGTFFLGLAAGVQKVGASVSKSYSVTDSSSGSSIAVPALAALNVTSPFITPHLGWYVATRWGFTFGIEGGLQIPINTSSDIDLEITDATQAQYLDLIKSSQPYQDAETNIENEIGKYLNIKLPYAAIRLGWTF
jgi:hypothetical protein